MKSTDSSNNWVRTFCRLSRQTKSLAKSLRNIARPHELSVNEALLLLVCSEQQNTGGYAQNYLAELTTMSPAAVSGHLDSLRQRDWVQGSRDDNDRRRQTWRSTARGQTVADNILEHITTNSGAADENEQAATPRRRVA